MNKIIFETDAVQFCARILEMALHENQIVGLERGKRYEVFFQPGWFEPEENPNGLMYRVATYVGAARRHDLRPILRFSNITLRNGNHLDFETIEADESIYRIEPLEEEG